MHTKISKFKKQKETVVRTMPLLQVRDFPEQLYFALEQKAKEERRSISQQTIVLLSNALGEEHTKSSERKKTLEKMGTWYEENPRAYSMLSNPVDMVREDRER